jgi:hypothetical protein
MDIYLSPWCAVSVCCRCKAVRQGCYLGVGVYYCSPYAGHYLFERFEQMSAAALYSWDPMHVCSLLFCVCWVWYYTYSVEYYSFTYAMLLVCSIVPCPAVSRIFYGIWTFHSSRIFLSIWTFLCSIASMKIHYTGTIVYYVCLWYCSCHCLYAVVAVSIDLLVCL